MMKFINLAIATVLSLGVAQADDHTSYFAVGYKSMELSDSEGDLDVTGTQLTLGTQVAENTAVELNLVTFVDVDFYEVTSTDVSILYYPMGNGIFGRLGYSEGEIEFEDISVDDGTVIYGVGYDIPVGESGAVRIEYTSAEYSEGGGDVDVEGLTISAGVRF
ncbi:porin family protein [Alphaproteobacteria bacterium]|nr:porin family protein [Alphaproteobacteria bacterium]